MNDWLEAETRIERAFALTEREQWTEALTEIDAALAINPHDASWHAQRGHILDQLDRYEDAISAYRSALSLGISDLEVETVLGIDLIRVGRYEEAVRLFEKLSREHPDYEPALCYRIAAHTRLGQYELAEEMFYLAQQLTDACPNCFHHMAEALACSGRLDRAIYCWQRALEIEPDYPQARQRIAEAYRAQKQYEKARAFYVAELRHNPGNTDAMADLGDLLVDMDALDEAAAKFGLAAELEPRSARPHVMLGLIASQKGDPDTALRHLEIALRLDEHFPGLRSHLGETELRRGDHYEAMRHLSLALEDDPEDLVALMAMGNCHLELLRPNEAAVYFEKAIDLEPTLAGAHHNLGVCCFLWHDFRRGIGHCLDALRIEPRNVMFMHKLVLAYAHLGQWGDARRMLDRGLRTDPRHPGLRLMRKRLWTLRLGRVIRKCLPWR